jgi:hypothetical protein
MISDKFAVEDIYLVRYESYGKSKNITVRALIEDTKKYAEEGKKIEEIDIHLIYDLGTLMHL